MPKRGGTKHAGLAKKRPVSRAAHRQPAKKARAAAKPTSDKSNKIRPVSSRLLFTALAIGAAFTVVWLLNIPSPEAAYDRFLNHSLEQDAARHVSGSNQPDGSETNGQSVIDLTQQSFRQKSDMVCHYPQADGQSVTAVLGYYSDNGTEYVRLNSVDGQVSQAGETIDLASKYAVVTNKWFWYQNDDLAHFTESQLENRVIIGLAALSAPDVDHGKALAAIKSSGVFSIVSVVRHKTFRDRTYDITIRANRDAYVKMLEAAVPLLGNRSEIIYGIFGSATNLDTVISLRAIDSEPLYQTSSMPDQCAILSAKLFGDHIAGRADTLPVTTVPVVSKTEITMPSDAQPFAEYLRALGLSL